MSKRFKINKKKLEKSIISDLKAFIKFIDKIPEIIGAFEGKPEDEWSNGYDEGVRDVMEVLKLAIEKKLKVKK